MARTHSPPARGVSLIEMMIAMAIITVGLLAMWNLHMVGITSTAAGRRHTVATALARELVQGLERLSYSDVHITSALDVNAPGTPTGLPADQIFGPLVDGSGSIKTTPHVWSDGSPIPGVRLDSQMRENAEGARFERRWTVWNVTSPSAPAGSAAGVKLIAVSVTWHDPPFARPREVVLYTQVTNPGAVVSGLANTQ